MNEVNKTSRDKDRLSLGGLFLSTEENRNRRISLRFFFFSQTFHHGCRAEVSFRASTARIIADSDYLDHRGLGLSAVLTKNELRGGFRQEETTLRHRRNCPINRAHVLPFPIERLSGGEGRGNGEEEQGSRRRGAVRSLPLTAAFCQTGGTGGEEREGPMTSLEGVLIGLKYFD